MDIYKLKFTKLQSGIFRLLCIKAGEALTQGQIARLLHVSPTAVSKALAGLNNLVTIEKSTLANFVKLKDTKNVTAHKRAENLKLLIESGFEEEILERFPGTTIVLFGSFSRGEDTVDSDIDIAVIGAKEKRINVEKYEKILERSITIQFFITIKNKHLKQSILNGITLQGAVELSRTTR